MARMHNPFHSAQAGLSPLTRPCLGALVWFTALAAAGSAVAQTGPNFPISGGQRATAAQVAQKGVPLSELAPNAPDSYVVKRGDTLWSISGLFLAKPWRWPELWGMNLNDIRNPHLIYPGQRLVLEKRDGRATLGMAGDLETVKVSPRTRFESLAEQALPTIKTHLIEPFLAEPLIVDEATFRQAPRVVAALEGKVLMARGDRVYARGSADIPLAMEPGDPTEFRLFRTARPLKDPVTNEVLGYEAQYVGKAQLVRAEGAAESTDRQGRIRTDVQPGTVDIVANKEEIRVGDRLLPEPPRELVSYTPRAPDFELESGRVVSIYGSAVQEAAQNQVIALNIGAREGMVPGHVVALQTDGARVVDRTDPNRPTIKLPDERNGLAMVFRTFDRVSYALILEIRTGVKVGDKVINPR